MRSAFQRARTGPQGPERGRALLAIGAATLAACLTSSFAISASATPVAPPAASAAAFQVDDGSKVTPVRTIVTTDPELDDLNSLLRMLLYANEIDIEGLVYSSSQHHWAGDPAQNIAPHRWPASDAIFHIDEAVNAYEVVYPNLVMHDSNYPTPEELRSKIVWGNVMTKGDMAADTPGSDLIKDALLSDEPGPINLQAWGGPSTIARALLSIQEEFEGTPGWEELHAKISAKTVITSFGQQDDTFSTYIRPNWPEIEQREVATSIWGYFARSTALPADQQYLGSEWTRTHVSEVGPIGAAYRVWGDGKQMAAGFDDEDYFGLSGYTRDELVALGYGVWMPPQDKDSWISEGDSSNFALLIQNGLRNTEDPSYGGWGGRQGQNPADPFQWSNKFTTDADDSGAPRADYSAARWFEDFQLDFAARLQWSVTSDFAQANHEPAVTVPTGLTANVKAGSTIAVLGAASDPDGDALSSRWWQYNEAGSYPGAATISVSDALAASVTIPADAQPGETIHVILEVEDAGSPALTSYQRVILTVVDEYAPALEITEAHSASTTGSTTVTLAGEELYEASAASINSVAVTDLVVAADGRSVSFVAPPSEQAGPVSVEISAGEAVLSAAIDYLAPTVSEVSPRTGPTTGGTAVTVTGEDLALATSATVGGVEGSKLSVDSAGTGLTFTTPQGTAGSQRLVIELPGVDVVVNDAFTYEKEKDGAAPGANPSSPADSSNLARTGIDGGIMAALIAGMLALGGALVGFARLRQRTR